MNLGPLTKPQAYIVAEAHDINILAKTVNQYIENDYVPLGGIGIVLPTEYTIESYYQAMVHERIVTMEGFGEFVKRQRLLKNR